MRVEVVEMSGVERLDVDTTTGDRRRGTGRDRDSRAGLTPGRADALRARRRTERAGASAVATVQVTDRPFVRAARSRAARSSRLSDRRGGYRAQGRSCSGVCRAMARCRRPQARRDIAAGEALTQPSLIVPPARAVRRRGSRDVSTGVVEVTGVGRASGSGHVGDMIRVLMPTSRRRLNARITGPGAVEIVQMSKTMFVLALMRRCCTRDRGAAEAKRRRRRSRATTTTSSTLAI